MGKGGLVRSMVEDGSQGELTKARKLESRFSNRLMSRFSFCLPLLQSGQFLENLGLQPNETLCRDANAPGAPQPTFLPVISPVKIIQLLGKELRVADIPNFANQIEILLKKLRVSTQY